MCLCLSLCHSNTYVTHSFVTEMLDGQFHAEQEEEEEEEEENYTETGIHDFILPL